MVAVNAVPSASPMSLHHEPLFHRPVLARGISRPYRSTVLSNFLDSGACVMELVDW